MKGPTIILYIINTYDCQNKICDNGNPGPPDVSNRQSLSKWLVNLHNQANIMLNNLNPNCNLHILF